ncbi:MAG: transposase [Pseudomonadota bacterium]
MASTRRETVVEGEEGVYHCISRCVRRAFLCGRDPYTGQSFEHRKEWVQRRLEFLAALFAVEVCAYAVMSNHLHVVIRTRPDWAEGWSDEETARRWLVLCPPRDEKGRRLPLSAEMAKAFSLNGAIGEKRVRLGSVSWFMRCLNETIARWANREDGCKGRFWEGRFKCQSLLDDAAVLACLVYVDLNPVRAGLADSPETSLFTSGYERISALEVRDRAEARPETALAPTLAQSKTLDREERCCGPNDWLCPLGGGTPCSRRGILDLTVEDYLSLLDWSGRQLKTPAAGTIPAHLDPILDRLGIEKDNWPQLLENYEVMFHRVVGRVGSIRKAARKAGLKWFQGLRSSRASFSNL